MTDTAVKIPTPDELEAMLARGMHCSHQHIWPMGIWYLMRGRNARLTE